MIQKDEKYTIIIVFENDVKINIHLDNNKAAIDAYKLLANTMTHESNFLCVFGENKEASSTIVIDTRKILYFSCTPALYSEDHIL